MKKIWVIVLLIAFPFFTIHCNNPDEDEENPRLRVKSELTGYKLTDLIVNNQIFTGENESILPGSFSGYKRVNPGKSLIISYHWENTSKPDDKGDFSRITSSGEFIELVKNNQYTLIYSNKPDSPDIELIKD